VYALAEGRAVLKPVTILRQNETEAVVGSGIVPPERVLTSGFARLTSGEAVRVVDPEPAPPGEAAPARRSRPLEGEAALPRERRRRPGVGGRRPALDLRARRGPRARRAAPERGRTEAGATAGGARGGP
jgi:multidrug efflux system membrane fusion protein